MALDFKTFDPILFISLFISWRLSVGRSMQCVSSLTDLTPLLMAQGRQAVCVKIRAVDEDQRDTVNT